MSKLTRIFLMTRFLDFQEVLVNSIFVSQIGIKCVLRFNYRVNFFKL